MSSYLEGNAGAGASDEKHRSHAAAVFSPLSSGARIRTLQFAGVIRLRATITLYIVVFCNSVLYAVGYAQQVFSPTNC